MRAYSKLLVALLPLFLIACYDPLLSEPFIEESTEQGVTSSGEVLELSAIPNSIDISAGGTVMIMVRLLYPNQRPIVGETVKLSATLGTLTETELTTDSDGCASTTLTPGEQAGWCVVAAVYRSAYAKVAVAFYDSSAED